MSTDAATLELPEFRYLDEGLRGEAFHARMGELAASGWLARTELGYAVLDREACEFFLRCRQATFPGRRIGELFGIEDGPLHEELENNILCIDGADHARLRGLVNPALTARAVERYRPLMRGFLEELIGPVIARGGTCEFVSEVARPYPALTIAAFMGAPLQDADRLHHWSNVIQRQFASNLHEERAEIEAAVSEFYLYVRELIAHRRAEPGEDLISRLIAAEQDGDRLSETECVNLALNVLIGGVDTTQSQLAHAVRLLAEHPEQWALLAERPELAGAAVREAIRHEPITPFSARITTAEVEFRGVRFPADTVVLACAFTANRDGEGEEFDITAERGGRTLTFGAGIHYCLGANLATAELEEALTLLPARLPGLRLDGEPRFGTPNGIHHLEALPVRFSSA